MRALRFGAPRFNIKVRGSDNLRLFVAYFPVFIQSFLKSVRVPACPGFPTHLGDLAQTGPAAWEDNN